MGFRRDRRQGGLGLFVQVTGTVEDEHSGAAWPAADVPPRLWAALVSSVGEGAARALLGLRGGDPKTRKKIIRPTGQRS